MGTLNQALMTGCASYRCEYCVEHVFGRETVSHPRWVVAHHPAACALYFRAHPKSDGNVAMAVKSIDYGIFIFEKNWHMPRFPESAVMSCASATDTDGSLMVPGLQVYKP